MGFFKILFKELWEIKPKTVMGIMGGLGLVLIIGLTPFYTINFEDNWAAEDLRGNKTLFTLNKQKYTQSDFAVYLERNKTPIDQTKIISTINKMYQDWIEKTCNAF